MKQDMRWVPAEATEEMLNATKGPGMSPASWNRWTKKRHAKLYRQMVAAAPSLPAGDGLTDDQVERINAAVLEALMQHGLSHTCDADSGERFPLVDKLCAPSDDTIETGKSEVQRIAETVVHAVLECRILAAPRQSGEVGAGVELERMCSGRDWWEHALPNSELARPAAAAAAQRDAREAIAWVHEDDPARAISAPQKAQMLRDGGASASSVKGYSIAAVVRAAQQVQGASQPAFGFTISDGKDCGIRVLTWESGGCRPAEETECAMWDMLAVSQPQQAQADAGAVPIARQVRATLNLIANSFHNCKGSAATMQELARDCLRNFNAAHPSPAGESDDAALLGWLMRNVNCDEIDGLDHIPFGLTLEDHFRAFRDAIRAAMSREQSQGGANDA